jgi:sugar phosphate isomerase/epimerase
MLNPRLSVDSMCTFNWSFEDDLNLWRSMGVKHAAPLISKVIDDPAGKLGALKRAGIECSTLILGGHNLANRQSWDATRAMHRAAIDHLAAIEGKSIYFTSGRTVMQGWDRDVELLTEAVAPTVAYGKEKGVAVALEPTQRPDVSFVTNLADAIDVADRTGLKLIADFGVIWLERDLKARLRRAMPHIQLIQFGDFFISSPLDPKPSGRAHVGQGELPVKRLIQDVLDAGYTGLFDLEVVGNDFTQPTDEAALRRGILAASALLDELGIG